MKIQYNISRHLTVAFFATATLFCGESSAGLIVDSIDSRFSANGGLFYDPTPRDGGAVSDQSRFAYSGADEISSTDLSAQSVDIDYNAEVNNFDVAPTSDRYSLASRVSATASDTESGGVRTFQSLLGMDYGPVEAPDNPDYTNPDEGMFGVSARHIAAVRFHFSIDTPHEYTFSYAVNGADNNHLLSSLIRFQGEERIVEDSQFFSSIFTDDEISGILQPGSYFIVNDVSDEISMEHGVPFDFGSAPFSSNVSLALRDLDTSNGDPDTGGSVPVPGSVWLLLSGIGLLRLRHRQRS